MTERRSFFLLVSIAIKIRLVGGSTIYIYSDYIGKKYEERTTAIEDEKKDIHKIHKTKSDVFTI